MTRPLFSPSQTPLGSRAFLRFVQPDLTPAAAASRAGQCFARSSGPSTTAARLAQSSCSSSQKTHSKTSAISSKETKPPQLQEGRRAGHGSSSSAQSVSQGRLEHSQLDARQLEGPTPPAPDTGVRERSLSPDLGVGQKTS